MFSLICARINGWVNNREAGDLTHHRAHYDATVMSTSCVRAHYVGALLYAVWRHHHAGLDANGCPLGNSKLILLSDNLNRCLWLSACQVEKIDEINPWSIIYQWLSQLDLQYTHSCNFYLFDYALKRIKSDSRATLDTSMADLLHIVSLEGILLVVDEDVMPTLTM